MVTKDITTVVESFGVTFNYYDYTDKISSCIYENFEKYLISLDRLLDIDNAYEIDKDDLKGYRGRYFKDEELIKKSINSIYIIEVYELSYHSLERFRSKKSLGIETMEKMLNKAESDLGGFVNFLCQEHPDKMVRNVEAIETIINSTKGHMWKAKLKAEDKDNLFKDMVICKCGGQMVRRKNIRSAFYKCKKRTHKKEDIDCDSKNIREKDIVNEVFKKTGIKIKDKEEATKLVKKITIMDTQGTFEIQYNFKENKKI